jgi:hypothetical protein
MSTTVIFLGFLLGVPLLLWWFTLRARTHGEFPLRPIAAFQALHGLLGRAAESGKVVHLSLGSSGIGGDQTAVASAGLSVLRYLADQGSAIGISPVVSVADPTMLLAAQNVLYQAYWRQGRARDYRPTDVQMIAPDRTAYAVGAQEIINSEHVAANVMVGDLGPEYLLMGEAGAQREIVQLVGSNAVETQPLMLATSDNVLLGEEVFAVGAYLTRHPLHVASLQVQDALRVLIVIAIIIGVAVKTVFG